MFIALYLRDFFKPLRLVQLIPLFTVLDRDIPWMVYHIRQIIQLSNQLRKFAKEFVPQSRELDMPIQPHVTIAGEMKFMAVTQHI